MYQEEFLVVKNILIKIFSGSLQDSFHYFFIIGISIIFLNCFLTLLYSSLKINNKYMNYINIAFSIISNFLLLEGFVFLKQMSLLK